MPLTLFNEGLDDTPEISSSEGFTGADFATPANLLPVDTVRAGRNIYFTPDGIAQTRPGLRLNANRSATAGTTTSRVQGMIYYDIPGFERSLFVRDGVVYEVATAEAGAASAVVAGITPSTSAPIRMAQLVDSVFMADASNTLRWARYTAGSWSTGTVATFANTTAMPAWGGLCAHRFRLFAFDAEGNRLYASAIGQANAPADWVQTDNIRVGNGEGDPIVALISGQAGNLIVLCQASAWAIDTTAANLADYSVTQITNLTGCVAAATALQIGQDVLFLSRYGVVSLGALADNISINAATTLSAPMQPIIDSINWSAINTAFATSWQELYLLCVPVNVSAAGASPSLFLVYNTRTRRWNTPWSAAPATGVPAYSPFSWTSAAISRFAGKQETLLGDNAGRIFRIEPALSADDEAGGSAPITCHFTTKAEDFGAAVNPKSPFWCKLTFSDSTATASYAMVRDGNVSYPESALTLTAGGDVLEQGITTGTLGTWPILFPLVFVRNILFERSFSLRGRNRFHEASIQIVATLGRLRVRRVRLAAFIDSPDLD